MRHIYLHVFMCVYTCTCMHAYIHTYRHTYILTYRPTQQCTQAHTVIVWPYVQVIMSCRIAFCYCIVPHAMQYGVQTGKSRPFPESLSCFNVFSEPSSEEPLHPNTVDSQKLEYRPGMIYAGLRSSQASGIEGWSCSTFRAFTASEEAPNHVPRGP